jgi:hypothetical protein
VSAENFGIAVADDANRHTMGARGRELVAAKYQWAAVGRAMAGVYESVVERQGAVAG